ncbi:Crp/Fnr family transcriptional regulator [Mesorhizobium sp.]|uniref:Crp/Fnr family transcriptional regulator n=1 Tax=Mesorhizobium sp. TaxID=1871066 RepID=UPI0012019577|nr:Crp/Fnr family transcriptional regulator [Mesorhizobium sp.]TIS54217.1 MAG: Crp/Fnr family transcriptional regulator [Mesorhizobium sp.]TIS88583.1 MAG: Crp/Fnr family transcriptional regulator [Mesorhizobium sp.]
MSDPRENPYKNELLRRMSADDLALLQPHLERRTLELKTALETTNGKIDAVYFMEEGIGSVIARTPGNSDAEVGFIGFEGMTGSALVMGTDHSPHECRVQMAGEAIRIDADRFTAALETSPTLRLFLLRYVHYLHIQTGYTALINARSKLEDRLARWLLMCDDRVIGGRFLITHEFLSIMLGVRRPGVTVALQLLEGRGLIRAQRGEILVRDRDGLVALTDGYGPSEAEYVRLVGEIAWR